MSARLLHYGSTADQPRGNPMKYSRSAWMTATAMTAILAVPTTGCSSSHGDEGVGESSAAQTRNTAPAEACVGAVLATAAWCRTPLTCAATVAAVCGTCVDRGCVARALDALACDPGNTTITGPYPDGSCCSQCANGLTDICDPNLCPSRPSCNDPDAYGKCH